MKALEGLEVKKASKEGKKVKRPYWYQTEPFTTAQKLIKEATGEHIGVVALVRFATQKLVEQMQAESANK